MLKNRAYERRGRGRFCSIKCGARKYKVDESYFDKIDTEEKAYWLGFIDGDGYQNGQELIINLGRKDEHHLAKLKEALRSEHPIKLTEHKITYRGMERRSSIARLGISSQTICTSLEKLGCFRAKSLTVLYPPIDKNLDRHFIRGVFDADGCLYVSKKGHRKWSLHSASPIFLTTIKDKLMDAGINVANPPSQGGRNLTASRGELIEKLHSYLYDGASVFLGRKESKFGCTGLLIQ